MSLALTVERLAAGWGDTKVLHEVSFTIPAGGSLALLGRNGVGKSTLLHAIMGSCRWLGARPLYVSNTGERGSNRLK
jgi:branched-chain amino acid transport system ATP-binding protein